MTRDQLISLFFIALMLFAVYEIFRIFSVFYRAIFWGGILAFAFYPIYQKVKQAIKAREVVSAALMTIFVFLIVVPPVAFMLASMTAQAIELYQSASTYVREGHLEKLIEQIRSVSFVQSIEARMGAWEPLKQNIAEWVLNTARAVGVFGTVQVGTLTRNFFFVVLNLFLTFVLLFVFLLDGEEIYRFIYKIAPLEERNKKFIFRQINETFAAVIRGQLLTSLTQAVLAGVIFWMLGLPIPIFFAGATFIATMIPVVGASFVWFPYVFYLAASGEYVKAVILLILGTLVISLADNILKPALIGKKTKLPYFLLFFGVMGGIKIYGLMGIFIAPVVLSLFFALITIYQQKYMPSET